jgi:hypothetical protein
VKKEAEQPESAEPTYTKQQYLTSKRFLPQQKDVLVALLNDDQRYTVEQVDGMLDSFYRAAPQ